MPRSNLVNAVDVALADPVAGADPTIRVTDPERLPEIPFYLVIDPFNLTSGREYLYATAIALDVLTVTRNLEGTESTTHDAGDIVRITYTAQHLEDVWDDIEAIPPQTYLHSDLTDVITDQHHARYTDTEAIDAVGPLFSGAHDDLTGVTEDQHHSRYTDEEAQDANPADLHHFVQTNAPVGPDIGSVWVNPDEPPEATYLPLTGGQMLGLLILNGGPTQDLHAATKKYVDDNVGETAWNNLQLGNGWAFFGPNWATPRYRKDRDGVVHVQGMISGGTVTSSTVVATLPVGFQPQYDLVLIIYSATGPARVNMRGATGGTPGAIHTEEGWSATWTAINFSFPTG